LQPHAPGPFAARSSFWTLHDLTLADLQLDAFSADRDDAMIRAFPADHLFLIVMIEGTTRFSHSGGEQLCGPGDACLLDMSRTMRTVSSRQHCITAAFSRAFVEEASGPVRAHGRLPRSAHTALLVDFVRSLAQRLPSSKLSSVVPLSRICRDLLATAIEHPKPEPVESLSAKVTRQRAVQYIAAQAPGELSLPAMQAHLGLTRASLYRLFRTDGGVLAFDRRRRLRLLHRALSDPLEHRSIGELGFAHGFADQAHLSRIFRAAFGYTMGGLRQHLGKAEERPLGASPVEACRIYRESVAELSD
jgi:AraC-like DNA-binding protein